MPRRMRRGLSRKGRRSATGGGEAGMNVAGGWQHGAHRAVARSLTARLYCRNVNLASPAMPRSHGHTNEALRGMVWARIRR